MPNKAGLKNPLYTFLFSAVGLYAIWYGLYEFWLKDNSGLDNWIISHIVNHARVVFNFLGAELQPVREGLDAWNWMALKDSVGVIVGPPCNGLALFALFIIFIISFPGPWKHKAWYLPLGIVLIHLVNVLRVIALVSIVKWNEEWLEFNHDYTFTILVYLFVFLFWYIWVSKFSPLKSGGKDV